MKKKPDKNKRIDAYTTTSKKSGLTGKLESFIRHFREITHMAVFGIVIFVVVINIGIALTPGVMLAMYVNEVTTNFSMPIQAFSFALSLAISYYLYGITIIFTTPIFNLLIIKKLKPFRGPWQSLQTIPWFMHNALTYCVRYTFLEFVTPSPLALLFYKMMGMKVGKGVVLNTTNISDPAFIVMGDYVTVGGSATIFAHYAQKGYLIVEPTVIGNKVNIGLKASIMGAVTIGDEAMVLPHTVVLPKTIVKKGEKI